MVITSSIFDAEKPSEEEESDIVVPRLEKASKTMELVLATNQLQEKDVSIFLSISWIEDGGGRGICPQEIAVNVGY